MKTLIDVTGQKIEFDEQVAAEKARRFLDRKFPAAKKHSASRLKRAIKALEREARGVEIGALEREFADG